MNLLVHIADYQKFPLYNEFNVNNRAKLRFTPPYCFSHQTAIKFKQRIINTYAQ